MRSLGRPALGSAANDHGQAPHAHPTAGPAGGSPGSAERPTTPRHRLVHRPRAHALGEQRISRSPASDAPSSWADPGHRLLGLVAVRCSTRHNAPSLTGLKGTVESGGGQRDVPASPHRRKARAIRSGLSKTAPQRERRNEFKPPSWIEAGVSGCKWRPCARGGELLEKAAHLPRLGIREDLAVAAASKWSRARRGTMARPDSRSCRIVWLDQPVAWPR